MSKPTLRYMALGFLISAIVLAGYRLFLYEPQVSADHSTTNDSVTLSKEEASYKEKYESLLAETEVANLTKDKESSKDTETASSEKPKEEDSATKSSESSKPEVVKTTIVINDGDPSSVAVQQLEDQGIIEDSSEFETFLEENDYISLLRPGSYEVTSEMDFQKIADVLMGR